MSKANWQDFATLFVIVWFVFLFWVLKRFKEQDEWPRE